MGRLISTEADQLAPARIRANLEYRCAIVLTESAKRLIPRWTCRQRMSMHGRSHLLLLVGVVLLLGCAAPDVPASPDVPPHPVRWHTDVVEFVADDFYIETDGRKFVANVPHVDVRSDPGTATYRTLEVTWQEHGVEMRLFLYLTAD